MDSNFKLSSFKVKFFILQDQNVKSSSNFLLEKAKFHSLWKALVYKNNYFNLNSALKIKKNVQKPR